jgi:DNA-binding GntR family transcriptional regulator
VVERVASKQASTDIAARVRQAILKGQFLPNERLVEVDLAAAFGSNRANIRTALALLEQERLVVREPNRGARVRFVTDVEAIEIYEARAALEAVVARQAALKAGADDCKRLADIIAAMEATIKESNLVAFSELNGKLHGELSAIAGNATLIRLLEGLRSHVIRWQYRTILVPGRVTDSLVEHRLIVEAVCAGAPDAAEQAMRHHLEKVTDNLRRAMANANIALF